MLKDLVFDCVSDEILALQLCAPFDFEQKTPDFFFRAQANPQLLVQYSSTVQLYHFCYINWVRFCLFAIGSEA